MTPSIYLRSEPVDYRKPRSRRFRAVFVAKPHPARGPEVIFYLAGSRARFTGYRAADLAAHEACHLTLDHESRPGLLYPIRDSEVARVRAFARRCLAQIGA